MEAKQNTTLEYNKNLTIFQHVISNKTSKYPQYARSEISSIKKQDFKTTTELIARRIVNKQLEFRQISGQSKKERLQKPDIAVKMNNVVVQRILHFHMKENKNRQAAESRSRSSSPSRTTSAFSVASKHSTGSDCKNLRNNQQSVAPTTQNTSCCQDPIEGKLVRFKKPLELPRFQLSTNSGKTRALLENRATQVNLDQEYKTNTSVQTERNELVKYSSVQATPEPNLAGKKLQTRLFKQCDSETTPIFMRSPEKSTNTQIQFYTPYVDRQTQFFEYISDSDLFCLDWINKHLFPIDLNQGALIVDKKLRDVSEVCTKSTLFSQWNMRHYHREKSLT